MTPDEIKAREKQLAEREAAIQSQETAFAERETRVANAEARASRAEAAEFAEKLVAKGQLLPTHKNRVVELLHSLSGSKATLEFAEGDTQHKLEPAAALRGFLESLPNLVEYAEQAAAEADHGTPSQFTSPDHAPVDQAGLALHYKALAYAEQHDVDYETAVSRVGG